MTGWCTPSREPARSKKAYANEGTAMDPFYSCGNPAGQKERSDGDDQRGEVTDSLRELKHVPGLPIELGGPIQ